MTEADTARRLLAALPRLLPNLRVDEVRREARFGGGRMADLVARARSGDVAQELIFEIKSLGEPRMAEQAIMQLRELARMRPSAYPVFAAPYISERAREICKREGVGYLDLVGNAFLQFGSVLVDRTGADSRPMEKRGLRTLFAPKATRVVRALLQAPEGTTTITKLAQACSMSPAGVYLVVDLLDKKGFVERGENRNITLREPDRLLREWAKNWTWEKSQVSYYFSFDKTAEQIMEKVNTAARKLGLRYAYTGMAGASYVAPFVRYAQVAFYLEKGQEELVKELDLRPAPTGANVLILSPYDRGVFDGIREIRGANVVSDVQLFVDLFTFPARGEEQAEAVFEKAIRFPRAR
ncbi:hypothetical protein B1B_07538 [mine drainage metagenome]|uniref:HTH iclR-type domain-containing protein n=1 Tax=mine drainage metagenome TaxID=410659 RepID=T1AZH6_9ZZZZ